MPTRDEILDAAWEVVRARGVARTTTRAIARSAGCAEGSLYNHFSDKGELLGCVLAERLPLLVPFLRDLPGRAGHGAVADTLTELCRAAVAFFRELVPMIAGSLADPELLARHRALLGRGDRGPHRVVAAVGDYLAREQAAGRVRAAIDPTAAAQVLLGACFHHAVLELVLPEDLCPLDREAFVAGTVVTLLHGLVEADRG